MAILTDAKAKNIKPTDKPIAHGGVTGLRLMPSRTKGNGQWELRFVSPVTGKRRDACIGSYPAIGVAAAREKAEDMRAQIRLGSDPIELAKIGATPVKQIPTFEQAMLATLEIRCLTWKNEEKAKVRWLGRIKKHASILLPMRINSIGAEHIKAVLQPIWASQPDTARKLKTSLKHIFDWSEAHDYVDFSPIHKAEKQLGDVLNTENIHHPSMPYLLIPNFVVEQLKPSITVTQNIILFVILTAVRSANARYATWDQIDFDNRVWHIPANAMKSKKNKGTNLDIPLCDAAIQILKGLQGHHPSLIFPSPRKGVALSDMSAATFLRSRPAPSDRQDRNATLHGFRSSFKIWALEQSDFSDELSEVALGHVVGTRVRRAYARTTQFNQRRELMQQWSDFVMSNLKLVPVIYS